jgi:uncharacterized protein YjbI with pentapeptide repeats
MIVKNQSPFAFATKVVSTRPPAPEMLVVVKGVFSFAPGAPLEPLDRADACPTGDLFDEDDDDRAGACNYPTDFADKKLRAEVLLRGTYHAPRGRPVREGDAAITVGKLHKRVRVVGPRVWVNDTLASDPLELVTMPLTWQNAYGGPGFVANPVGKGHASKELPTVEAMGAPVRARGDGNVAMTFLPVSPMWPARAAKIGKKYGPDWERTRAPFVAEDFDWTYHHAAPPGQELDGYWKGDEALKLENLHPDKSTWEASLPGLRVKTLARSTSGDVTSIPMNLDTVFVDADAGRLTLVWRGRMAVRERDLSDVKSMLIVSEPLSASQGEAAHVATLEAFEKDPIGLDAARAEIEAEIEAGMNPLLPDVPPATGPLDKMSAALAEARPESTKLIANVRHTIAEATKAAAAMASGKDVAGELDREILKAQAAASDEPPVPISRKPGEVPSLGLRRRVRRAMEEAAKAKKQLAGHPVPPEVAKQLAKLDALAHDPTFPALDPEYSIPEPLSTDPPGPGANLVDRDFTGQDLSGMDLSNAKLDGAILTRANLTAANLRGASLRATVLFKADLTEADLSGADLTRANLAHATAHEATFAAAKLELAFLEDADLTEATFEEANLEWAALARADLSRARGRGAKLDRADLEEAKLTGASFENASMRGVVMTNASAGSLNLSGAYVRALSAEGANLLGAKLVRAHGERAYLVRAELDGADLSLAELPSAQLTEARLRDCEIYGADLRDARLYRADLSRSKLDRSNLLRSDLSNTRLDRTSFVDANLYDAKLLEAAGADATFTGANLDRSIYTKRGGEDGRS